MSDQEDWGDVADFYLEKVTMSRFHTDEIYHIEGVDVVKLDAIKTRLYDMTIMTADERRDLAHKIGLILDNLVLSY